MPCAPCVILDVDVFVCCQNLPPVQTPEVFGMHDNISISKELQETRQLFDNVLLTQGRSQRGTRAGGKSDEQLYTIANDILTKAITSNCVTTIVGALSVEPSGVVSVCVCVHWD